MEIRGIKSLHGIENEIRDQRQGRNAIRGVKTQAGQSVSFIKYYWRRKGENKEKKIYTKFSNKYK